MNRGAKILVVLGIMICGIGTSAMFRSAQTKDIGPDARFAGLNFRGDSSGGQNTLSATPTVPQQLDTVHSATSPPAEPMNTDQPPPRLPGGKGNRMPIPGQPATGQNGSSKDAGTPAKNRSLLDGTNWPTVTPSAENTIAPVERALRGHMHKLRDGDTLDDLARRYLGNPRRAREIFAANRHVLTDPQVLPLGRSIRIPPRRVARTAPSKPSVLSVSPQITSDSPQKRNTSKVVTTEKKPAEKPKRETDPEDPNRPIPLFGSTVRAVPASIKKPNSVAKPAVAKRPADLAQGPEPVMLKVLPLQNPIAESDQLVPLPQGALRRARAAADEEPK